MTNISWTDVTWNPTRGCRRISTGCGGANGEGGCYAERMAHRIVRMGKGKATPYEGLVKMTANGPRWTGAVAFDPEKLAEPLRWRTPRRVSVDSMSDLFYEGFSYEQIAAVYGVMAATPHITYQVLTKRARRRREWFSWVGDSGDTKALRRCGDAAQEAGARVYDRTGPAYVDGNVNQMRSPWNNSLCHWPLRNVWEGVSVEDQDAANERIPELLATPAAVRFLSCEPLIGPLNLHEFLLGFSAGNPAQCQCGAVHGFTRCPNYGGVAQECEETGCTRFRKRTGSGLHWIIAGAESGPRARTCDDAWLRSLRDQCAAAGVPFFLKQAREKLWPIDDDDPREHAGVPPTRVPSPVSCGPGSRRKPGGVIELPYLDGAQHAEFPEVTE